MAWWMGHQKVIKPQDHPPACPFGLAGSRMSPLHQRPKVLERYPESIYVGFSGLDEAEDPSPHQPPLRRQHRLPLIRHRGEYRGPIRVRVAMHQDYCDISYLT